MTERLDTKMKYEGFGSHGQFDYSHSIKTQNDFVSFDDNGSVIISNGLIEQLGDIEDRKVCIFLNIERENRLRTQMLNGEEIETKHKHNLRKELNLVFWTDDEIKTSQSRLEKKFQSRKLKSINNSNSMSISIKSFLIQYKLENLMKKRIRFQNKGVKIEDNVISVDLLSKGDNKIEVG